MRTMRVTALIIAMGCALISAAETVKGGLEERDNVKHTISVKVAGVVRTFTFDSSTRFLDKDGLEEPMLGRPGLGFWGDLGMEITIETGPDGVAVSIQVPIRLRAQEGSGSKPKPSESSTGTSSELVGKPLPLFKMQTTGGKTLTNEDLKGKVVVLDFWATWCTPCMELTPALQEIYNLYKSKDVVVIGADGFEPSDGKTAASAYAREHKYTFPFTFNTQAFQEKLGVFSIPCVFVVDKAGVVRNVFVGYTKTRGQDIEAAIKKLLPA